MCGICGFTNFNDKQRPSIADAMLGAIRHRGSDGSQVADLGDAVLGFDRLSFIDLDGGMQPIQNENGSITMICNGEIFNYRELRDELASRGHVFSTKTDVEVILHLYEERGTDFVKYLNGQFAIALYDSSIKTLYLFRDHIGICPLFYSVIDGHLVFASEIKAILEYPSAPRRLNMKAVDQLMNYPGVVSPETFFDGIRALQGGHMLVVRSSCEVKDVEYWDLAYRPDFELEDRGEAYYAERLRELMRDAISRRLVADVPVGFYISGGLDSSVVACFIGKYLLNGCYSFSAEIGSGELDESRFQKMVHDTVSSEHYCVKVTENEIWENLPAVIYHAESAVKEMSIIHI